MQKFEQPELFKRTFFRDKRRMGNPDGDGGYVIADNLTYDLCVSAGISNNVTFEIDFQKQYPKVPMLCFDGTIDEPLVDGIPVILKNISTENSNKTTNLESETLDYSNVFLKMDIERAEFSWLNNFSDLRRFKQIVIEVHMYSFTSADFNFYTKLLETHKLIHVHPNNYELRDEVNPFTKAPQNNAWPIRFGMQFPHLLECTFVRNSEFGDSTEYDYSAIPSPLDRKNLQSPDLPLTGYPWTQATDDQISDISG